MPHAAVSREQRGRAKSLRQIMTSAETLLWRYPKAHRVDSLGFRRQVPFGRFVADFACHSARLIVELDGESHDYVSRRNGDQARDAWFQSQSYTVLRFTNDQVLTNLTGVVEIIRSTAVARGRTTSQEVPPLPVPPPQGGKEQAAARRKSQQ